MKVGAEWLQRGIKYKLWSEQSSPDLGLTTNADYTRKMMMSTGRIPPGMTTHSLKLFFRDSAE
jgi:hypothetical protein